MHMSECSFQAYTSLLQIMCTNVSIPCSARYNAIYDEEDLHASLINLSVNGLYAESGMERLSISSGRRLPSGSWVRDRVSVLSEEQIKDMMGRAHANMLDKLKEFDIFNTPVTAAIDYHKIPRYDKMTDEKLVRSKHEDGTCRFECYATLQCVEQGRRAQICAHQVGCFDEKDAIIEKLVTESRLSGIGISLLLLDRGFFAIDAIKMLKKLHVRFMTPCIMNDGIKKALQEYIEGKRKSISRYTMGKGERSTSFTLVILPRPDSNKNKKRYLLFATNIPVGHILWNIHKLPEDYRSRWGIETGYRDAEEIRARTTSTNNSIRLLYFLYSLILYNAWLLANLMIASRFSLRMAEPIIQLKIMAAYLERMLKEMPAG